MGSRSTTLEPKSVGFSLSFNENESKWHSRLLWDLPYSPSEGENRQLKFNLNERFFKQAH